MQQREIIANLYSLHHQDSASQLYNNNNTHTAPSLLLHAVIIYARFITALKRRRRPGIHPSFNDSDHERINHHFLSRISLFLFVLPL